MARWPVYEQDEIADVVGVLQSGQVNAWTGPHVGSFEKEYATYLGRRHAIALANGTLALDLAIRVLGVGPGQEVIVTPRSFVASAACVPLAGGVPVFADVDPESQNLTAATIEAKITPKTRGIIVVHLAGWPCEMDAIVELAKRHSLWVIEDCAQAHGAELDGAKAGSFGTIAVFSFCQDKIISTGGEGGLLATDDDEIWERAWSFKDHGKSHEAVFSREHPPGFRWLHDSVGSNFRMTSIQAVIGSRQLRRLEEWNRARAANAQVLISAMRGLEVFRVPEVPDRIRHAWYRLYAFVRPERLEDGWSRDRIVEEINAAGVPCFTGSCPEIYREQAFRFLGPVERLPAARGLGETSLAFLVDPAQRPADMERAAAVASSVGTRAMRAGPRKA